MRASTPPDEIEVLLGEAEQAVGCGATTQRNSAQGLAGRGHDPAGYLVASIDLLLPGWEDVGIADPVTGHASRVPGAIDLLVSRDAGRYAVAALARYSGEEHRAWHVVGAMPAEPCVHLPLLLMDPLVAGVAVEGECLGQGHDPVEDRHVALCALDVVDGDVHLVHQSRVLDRLNTFGLVVAVEATSLSGLTGAARNGLVATDARDHVLDILFVIHHESSSGADSRRVLVAAQTAGQRFSRRAVLEVAEIAGDGSHPQVSGADLDTLNGHRAALNDL